MERRQLRKQWKGEKREGINVLQGFERQAKDS